MPQTPSQPRFGAIIFGDEILSGKRQDKHLPKLIELLAARGCTLSWAEYVGDERARLTEVLARALSGCDVVFSFGGIGATPDDHTRQCVAAALGVELVAHRQAQALIVQRMQEMAAEKGETFAPERADNIQRLQMGMLPRGAQIVPNPYNRIPGFSCRGPQGAWLHCVPGFPVMAWPMVAWALDEHHRALQRQQAYTERSIILFQAQESALTPLMEATEQRHPGLKVFSLPSVDHPEYGLHIELGIKGPSALVDQVWDDFCAALHAHGAKFGPQLQRSI